MIRTSLINESAGSMRPLILAAMSMWLSSVLNTGLIACVVLLVRGVVTDNEIMMRYLVLAGSLVAIRLPLPVLTSSLTARVSGTVRRGVRFAIHDKLERKGFRSPTADDAAKLTQLAVEGVEHLDLYYTVFAPQVIHGMVTPLTVLVVITAISPWTALSLLLAVPLIPVLIMLVNGRARRKLGQHWDDYTSLGTIFLDLMMGLSTLKVFNADKRAQERLDRKSESFRKQTMRVLRMQLNSVSIMDLVAFGGASLAVTLTIVLVRNGAVGIYGGLFVILVSAEFFLPLRALGSAFHVAMNGIASYDAISTFLTSDERKATMGCANGDGDRLEARNLHYTFKDGVKALENITLSLSQGTFTALVGKSGSGKSTTARLLMGADGHYEGSIRLCGTEIRDLETAVIMRHVTYVSSENHLFNMSVRDNLRLGNKEATETMMMDALREVRMDDFVNDDPSGLNRIIAERSSDLSGGEKMRLLLARALLMDRKIYVFDEATASIDHDSEVIIMDVIRTLSASKAVLVVSHNLLNVRHADIIHVLDRKTIVQSGTHDNLIEQGGLYKTLYETQHALVTRTHKKDGQP
jgi:ABC-type transport system involved in cytochrome bd biosynthesis fused ATPase/permease subunit